MIQKLLMHLAKKQKITQQKGFGKLMADYAWKGMIGITSEYIVYIA